MSTEAEVDAAYSARERTLDAVRRKYHFIEQTENAKYEKIRVDNWVLVESGKLSPEQYDDICMMAWEVRSDVIRDAGNEYNQLSDSTWAEFVKVRDKDLLDPK